MSNIKGKEVQRRTNNGSVNKQALVSTEKFHTRLNQPPNQREIKENKFAGNSKYLPISFIEMELDELFFGQWSTENFKYQVIANELVGSLDLVYFHPVFKSWIRRTGAAAVPIQVKSGTNAMDVNNKITNTLVKDFPHLKSSCLTNAARSIGKRFGRDLNRKFNDQYQPIVLPSHEKQTKSLESEIGECLSVEGLQLLYQAKGDLIMSENSLIIAYNTKKKELSK